MVFTRSVFRPGWHRGFRTTGLAALLAAVSAPLGAITITEIQYDPPGSAAGLEFIELHNDSPTVADVSGWAFTEGIDFIFGKGAWIPGRGYIVLCADETAFRNAYPGVTPAGVFGGRLDSSGEIVVLSNNGGGEVLRIRFRDRGKWPSLPAGTGHTLALRSPHLDPGEPESWTASAQPGGTPAAANFPTGGSNDVELIAVGAAWSYKKGTEEFSSPADDWTKVAFPATGWLAGPTTIGYETAGDPNIVLQTSLTDMPNGYWSVAIRKTFSLTQAAIDSTDSLVLGMSYDDGFVAYLNGAEVVRASMPGSAGTPVPYNTAGVSHEAGVEEQFEIPRSLLVAGTNAIAIQGHNTTLTSSDFSLTPRLLKRTSTTVSSSSTSLVINELLGRTTGARWVELYNDGTQAIDLAGYFLSNDADELERYALPAGSTIGAGGYLLVTEADSGLDFSTAEVRIFLTLPDRSATILGQIFENVPTDGIVASRDGYSDARFPDGTGPFGYAEVPTPGTANFLEISRDVVINEILYNPPAGNTAGELVELYNRGASAVDLSGWAFTNGINFSFPPGTGIAPGSYLVVAKDPIALEAIHGPLGALGPWSGSLSNSGENLRLVDAAGNIADEVRYFDGGRWAPWADGGGSSLELIDPRQDNSLATAWDASDEGAKAQWTKITYSGSYGQEAQSEFHMMLVDSGTARVDDVSLKSATGQLEHIGNGTFEANTSPWLIQGNHVASRRIVTDAHSGSACLEINASGGGDNGVNKLDTDTSRGMTGGSYTVTFWARWIRGGDKILTRADSSTGASLQHVSRLELPAALGTPGAENSVRVALKALVPGGNLGPVIGDVAQSPVTPGPSSQVTVRARAQDADGIASLSVYFKTGGLAGGAFTQAEMFDDGAHGDGKASDGLFAGTLPAEPQGTKVLFYLEGADSLGEVRRYPVEAPSRTLLYAVEGASNTALITVRVNLDDENENTLRTRLLHSDDLVDASFVFNNEEIYYNVGVRYHGSPWNRPPDPKMFRVRFNEDRVFIRDLKAINLSRYGNAQNEGAAYFCVQSASTPQSPAPVGDYLYARVYHNTALHGQMAIVETVDSRYTEKWFPGDGDGYIYKIPGRRYLNDSGGMDSVDWTTLGFRGLAIGAQDEFERYRWYFVPGSNQTENRWADLNQLCQIMDITKTPVATFDAAIESILDVEQFLRVEAARVLQDDWDTIGIGNGQNAFIYFAPNEGRFKLLPWDMDHTFGNVAAKLYPEGSESQITRLVQRPKFRRMYLRIVQQMLGTSWDPAYIGPYLSQTQAVMGAGGSGILSFINSRRASVIALAPPTTPFKLTNIGSLAIPADWPGVYYTARSTERVRGTAPVSVDSIVVVRNEEQLNIPVAWGTTTWSLDVPIGQDTYELEIFGFGPAGELIGNASFTIVSTLGWQPPVVMAADPGFGPLQGGLEVDVTGNQFRTGARVFFGSTESTQLTVLSSTEIRALAPPSIAAGKVTVKVQNPDTQSGEKAAAFEYLAPQAFLRGDATGDGGVDLADAVRILFFLFTDDSLLQCLDAADADNNGSVNLTDAVAVLNYLFKGGPQPAVPFPIPGADPTIPLDGLNCAKGL